MFTNLEKTKLRAYLGFSELFRQIDMRLESQLDALPAANPDAETQVRAKLGMLDAIDAAIQGAALTNLDAVKVDELVLRGPEQLSALRQQGRMLVGQVAVTFDVQPPRDYFDGGSTGGCLALG